MAGLKISPVLKALSDKIVIFTKLMLKNFIKLVIILFIVFLFFKLEAGCDKNGFYWRITTPTQDIKKTNE